MGGSCLARRDRRDRYQDVVLDADAGESHLARGEARRAANREAQREVTLRRDARLAGSRSMVNLRLQDEAVRGETSSYGNRSGYE